jgi:predicted DNA-binding transcriptional regulator YafY
VEHAKERVATFAISRFLQIKPTGTRFAPPSDFDPKAYAKNAFGITGSENPIKIRLLFEPKLAIYITERQWHPSQECHRRRDGHVLMSFETTGRKQVIRWVPSWMPDVKVLPPKSLPDRVCEKL